MRSWLPRNSTSRFTPISRAVPDHHQLRLQPLANFREHLDDDRYVLDRAEVRGVHEHFRAGSSQPQPARLSGCEHVWIDEVVDDLDRLRGPERRLGPLLEE